MHGELLIDRLDRQILRLKLGSDVDGDPEGLRAVLLRDGRTVVEDRRRLALAGTAGRRATRDGGRIGDADASGSVPDAVVGWGGNVGFDLQDSVLAQRTPQLQRVDVRRDVHLATEFSTHCFVATCRMDCKYLRSCHNYTRWKLYNRMFT